MQCKNEKRWNIFFFFAYIAIAAWLFSILSNFSGETPANIPLFDLIIVIFAVFRLIRLFVYDRITAFVRGWFEETTASGPSHSTQQAPVCTCDLPANNPAGKEIEGKARCYRSGFKAAASHLISCPWCMGIWLALPVAFFYFLTPSAWLPLFILALAGLSSLLQLIANWIGWSAEWKKRRTEGR